MGMTLHHRPTLDAKWGKTIDLPPQANGPGSPRHPRFSADELAVLFYVYEKDTQADLWITRRTSPTEPFGPAMALPQPESSPGRLGRRSRRRAGPRSATLGHGPAGRYRGAVGDGADSRKPIGEGGRHESRAGHRGNPPTARKSSFVNLPDSRHRNEITSPSSSNPTTAPRLSSPAATARSSATTSPLPPLYAKMQQPKKTIDLATNIGDKRFIIVFRDYRTASVVKGLHHLAQCRIQSATAPNRPSASLGPNAQNQFPYSM